MVIQRTPEQAFVDAVAIAGGQSPFARGVGCTPGNINQLLKRGSVLPGKYVLVAERLTGVSKHELAPDMYPREDAARAPQDRPSDMVPAR